MDSKQYNSLKRQFDQLADESHRLRSTSNRALIKVEESLSFLVVLNAAIKNDDHIKKTNPELLLKLREMIMMLKQS